jgi:hypothetical protein
MPESSIAGSQPMLCFALLSRSPNQGIRTSAPACAHTSCLSSLLRVQMQSIGRKMKRDDRLPHAQRSLGVLGWLWRACSVDEIHRRVSSGHQRARRLSVVKGLKKLKTATKQADQPSAGFSGSTAAPPRRAYRGEPRRTPVVLETCTSPSRARENRPRTSKRWDRWLIRLWPLPRQQQTPSSARRFLGRVRVARAGFPHLRQAPQIRQVSQRVQRVAQHEMF